MSLSLLVFTTLSPQKWDKSTLSAYWILSFSFLFAQHFLLLTVITCLFPSFIQCFFLLSFSPKKNIMNTSSTTFFIGNYRFPVLYLFFWHMFYSSFFFIPLPHKHFFKSLSLFLFSVIYYCMLLTLLFPWLHSCEYFHLLLSNLCKKLHRNFTFCIAGFEFCLFFCFYHTYFLIVNISIIKLLKVHTLITGTH